MLPWTHKHDPNSVSEIVGQPKVNELKGLVSKKTKGILLFGPTGTGKTSSVYAVAKDLDLEILEVNASDTRNKNAIKSLIGSSTQQMSLFNKEKIILVDEIEGLNRKDRGCVKEIASIISSTSYPVAVICNVPFDKKYKDLRKKCVMVEYGNVPASDIVEHLKKICDKESISYDENVLKSIARRSNGDLRSAVNDAQVLSIANNDLKEDTDLGEREKKVELQDQMRLVFKSRNAKDVIRAFNNIMEDYNQVFSWMDYNIPYEYKGQDLAKAYEAMSKADIFNGRIRRWQYWRFLVYIYTYLTMGIALAKKDKSPGFVEYRQSTVGLKIWQAKMRFGKKRSVAEKFSNATHQSTKKSLNHFGDYKTFIKNNIKVQEELDISKEEAISIK